MLSVQEEIKNYFFLTVKDTVITFKSLVKVVAKL